MSITNKTDPTELNRIESELQEAVDKERFYLQQKNILKQKGKNLQRKERNHRVFTRGGMLEKFLREPLLLTNDQVFRILQESFGQESVRKLEDKLITESTEALVGTVKSMDTG